jgi:hypothetical protein
MDIAALKAAALVATPGPWHDSGGTVDNFGNEYQGSLSFEWAANGRDEGDGMNARYREDAAYIALANPTSILSLIARLEALEAELEWYGEQARLARLIHSEGDSGRHALAGDGGKRARAALEPVQS